MIPATRLNEPANHPDDLQAGVCLQQGNGLADAGDHAQAIACLRQGLERLGGSYGGPGGFDDSGMTLRLAEARLAAGQAPVAAALFQRVLRSRLQLYRRHHGLAEPPRPTST